MNAQKQSVGVGLILIALWIGFAAASAAAAPRPAPGAVYPVTTGADSGAGSLRAAITAANANPGRDTITWEVNCLDQPVQVVRPLSPLPAITDPIVINGAPGELCPFPMQLDGSYAGDSTDGLRLSAGQSTVRNLWIYEFAAAGLRLETVGGNLIEYTWISGNSGAGIVIASGDGNRLQNNVIEDNEGDGVRIEAASNNTVGGLPTARMAGPISTARPQADVGNRIRWNGRNGVTVKAGTGNAILGNSIYANGWLGIDLGDDNVTLNDLDGSDADAGPNNLQNFPILTTIRNSRVVTGTLDSDPNTTYRLEFFSNTAPDGSEFGEGETFVAALDVTTDVSGTVTFSVIFANPVANIAATATDPHGNTSEFSNVIGLIVNSTRDASDLTAGDGACDTGILIPDGRAECTLRAAIEEANAHAGKDIVTFDIPGGGAPVIRPASALPAITDPLALNATTQPGSGIARVVVDGKNAGAAVDGLRITAGESTLKGLAIVGFAGHGVVLTGAGGNTIERNDIGDSAIAAGISQGNGQDGVRIDRSPNNLVEGNVISRNGAHGVVISGTQATGNRLHDNVIGADRLAAADRGNAQAGVYLLGAVGNFIGGAATSQRNIISGNDGPGVFISGTLSIANTVQGNRIGTDRNGAQPLANAGAGIHLIQARATLIGGAAAGEGNLISGNLSHGVVITGAQATGNTVQGNTIGADRAGTGALANGGAGIHLAQVRDTTIGGAAAGEGNLISGNLSHGVVIAGAQATGNKAQGNLIGTDKDGQCALDAQGRCPLRNAGDGVSIVNASNNLIGGPGAGEDNRIAYNDGNGVAVSGGDRNRISANLIYANRRLGIDLEDDGVTLNDAGDADAGGNKGQNFPAIKEVSRNAATGATTITGTLNSTANTRFRLEFFAGPFNCDPLGAGQAATWLGAADNVQTNVSGTVTFTIAFPQLLPADQFVTATATDPTDNTSELSYATFSLRTSTPAFLPQTPNAFGQRALLYSLLNESARPTVNALLACAPELHVVTNGDTGHPQKLENDGGGLPVRSKADFNANDLHHSSWVTLTQNITHTLDLYAVAAGKGITNALLADRLTIAPILKPHLIVLTDLRELYREFELTGPGSNTADLNGNRILDYYDAVERLRQYAAAHAGIVMDVRQDAYTADHNYANSTALRTRMGEEIDGRLSRLAPHDADLKYVAIIGDDAVVPFYRLPVRAGAFSETRYPGQVQHTAGIATGADGNPTLLDTADPAVGAGKGRLMSDVPYGSLPAFLPDYPTPVLGVGRVHYARPLQLAAAIAAYEQPLELQHNQSNASAVILNNEYALDGSPHILWVDIFNRAIRPTFNNHYGAANVQNSVALTLPVNFQNGWAYLYHGDASPWTLATTQRALANTDVRLLYTHADHLLALTEAGRRGIAGAANILGSDLSDTRIGLVLSTGCHSGYSPAYFQNNAAHPYYHLSLVRNLLDRHVAYIAPTTYGTGDNARDTHHDLLLKNVLEAAFSNLRATIGEAYTAAFGGYVATGAAPGDIDLDRYVLYSLHLYGLPTQPLRNRPAAAALLVNPQPIGAFQAQTTALVPIIATERITITNFVITSDKDGRGIFDIPQQGGRRGESFGPVLPAVLRRYPLPLGATDIAVTIEQTQNRQYATSVELYTSGPVNRSFGPLTGEFTYTNPYPAEVLQSAVLADRDRLNLNVTATPLQYNPDTRRVTLFDSLTYRIAYQASNTVTVQSIVVNNGAPAAIGNGGARVDVALNSTIPLRGELQWAVEDGDGARIADGRGDLDLTVGAALVSWDVDTTSWTPGAMHLWTTIHHEGKVIASGWTDFLATGRVLSARANRASYTAAHSQAEIVATVRDAQGKGVGGQAGGLKLWLNDGQLAAAWREGSDGVYTATVALNSRPEGVYRFSVALDALAAFGVFLVDRAAPNATLSSPAVVSTPSFDVNISGDDDVSGINAFQVQYRVGVGGAWADWLTRPAGWDYDTGGYADLSPTFGPTEPIVVTRGTTYYFRVRAVDGAGNWEPLHGEPDTATTYQSGRLYLPVIQRR
jgi:CSLREA domain-containing protein